MERRWVSQAAKPYRPPDPKCVCGQDGVFGLAWPIVVKEVWFCIRCRPADYYQRRAL